MKTFNFHNQVKHILRAAKAQVLRSVNHTMVLTYYEIGRKIVEEEQQGQDRAAYGKQLIKGLSTELTTKFGKGFSHRNLEQMRQFYLVYSIPQTVSAQLENSTYQPISESLETDIEEPISKFNKVNSKEKPPIKTSEKSPQELPIDFKLSWSHYLNLMRIESKNERDFYEIESFKNNWSVRELKRQCESALYTRLSLSRNTDEIKKLSKQGLVLEKPSDAIKDPYILEFIGLPEQAGYSENDLEQALINKLENFLMELGTGFTFVARQKRISFDNKHFHIDLVFYNRILKSFVLIDLKIGELKHQDLGQMQMYVNYYDRKIRLEDENKTIGIVLCQNKSEAVVEYTLPENNKQIFASKYKTVLPNESDLKNLLQEPLATYTLKQE